MNEFQGVMTALATPFWEGEIDEESFVKLLRYQLENGVSGFVINGTTGESPTLTEREVHRLFEVARIETGRRIPILVGTGTNSTVTAIEKIKLAEKWGADGALVVVPYYNRPSQRGLIEHFKAVAGSADLPVILYNVPSRTVAKLELGSLQTLQDVPNIVGIKEASGDLQMIEDFKKSIRKPYWFLSGDDATGVEFCLKGGHGIISVISHIIPRELNDLVNLARQGDRQAIEKYQQFAELLRWLYVEANPVPVKWALFQMGIFRSPELRLPLIQLDAAHTEGYKACLKQLKKI